MKTTFLALASGLLLAFGWPTWGVPVLLFIAFVPLLAAERRIRLGTGRRKGWRVFLLSYLTFFLWNSITTYWLWYSSEFGAAFAILVNSLLMALLVLLYYHFAKRATFFIASVFLTCLWIGFEKLHLNWDFSWPWLNLGNGFSETVSWVQWYAYTGTFGGTLWVWLVNLSLFKTWLLYQETRDKRNLMFRLVKAALYILVPLGISLYQYSSYTEKEEPLEAVVLQPNIDPYSEKYNQSNTQVASLLFSLAKQEITDQTELIVAPETVFAENERLKGFRTGEVVRSIQRFITPYPEAHFLSGASLYHVFDDPDQATNQTNTAENGVFYNTYNSAFMVSQKPETDLYHKSKLVVGVESTPYVGIIKPLLGDIMLDLGGTVAMKTTQEDRGVFTGAHGNFGAGPIICYESVYGEFVTGYVRNGADVLTIITNDAWWGETQGHKQHLSLARLRAVETRRSIVRSANTGISGFINQRGDVLETLPYNETGALRGTVNKNTVETFYVRFGDFIYRIAMFVLIGVILIVFTKRRGEVMT